MRSLVEEVKDRLDVVDIVSGYVKLTPAGTNFRGICPFHREKTPSFMVSREKQIFHCFGCSKGGDVITFIQEIEGMEFKEALRLLAERAGLDYKKWQGAEGKNEVPDQKETLRRVLEATTTYYQKSLNTKEGERAKKYLLERGLTKESLENFRLGYAPAKNEKGFSTALFDYLRSSGFTPEVILASGSVYKKDGQEIYVDRFRERVMFPIADTLGRIVGFSARLLPGSDSFQGKYINTPSTILYDKGSLFYGFHLAKSAIRENGEVLMLEGNLDVALSHQAGVRQAVATCGTALGKKQLVSLRRYTDRLILAFDADMAGVKATKRAAELAWEEEFDVKVIPIKSGKDVADIVLDSPEKWRKMVERKKSVAGFFFNLAFKDRVLSLDQKKVLADKLVKLLAMLPSKVEQSYYLRKLSEEVEVPEEHLREKIIRNRSQGRNFPTKFESEKPSSNVNESKKNRKFLLEERLIGLVYNFPKLYFKNREKIDMCVFSDIANNNMWQAIKNLLDTLPKEKREKVKNGDLEIENRPLLLEISKIAMAVEEELGEDPDESLEKAEKEIKVCIFDLTREFLKNQRFQIMRDIKTAQKNQDSAEMNNLVKRLQEISKKIAI